MAVLIKRQRGLGDGGGERKGFPAFKVPPSGLRASSCQLLLPSEFPPKLEIVRKFCLSLPRELALEDRAQSEQLAADSPEMSGEGASKND